MSTRVHATFDGVGLRLDEPVDLPPNTRVVVTIEPMKEGSERRLSFLETAGGLNLDGPSDWSCRVEDYLYGIEPDAEE